MLTMIALIQRVTEASVSIAGSETARIATGLVSLIGVEKSDTADAPAQLADKLLNYRIFPDEQGKMNLDIQAAAGQLLLVPQFTLAADTRKGRRPSFSTAASPATASQRFDQLVSIVENSGLVVAQGSFGADMQVSLVNDGPVTFWLQV